MAPTSLTTISGHFDAASSSMIENPSIAASSSTSMQTTVALKTLSRINPDAESVFHRTTRPRLMRQVSAPEISKDHHLLVYAKEKGKFVLSQKTREKKSGYIWDYVDRKPNARGGFIDIFRIKDEFDDVTPKDRRVRANNMLNWVKITSFGIVFPAIEEVAKSITTTNYKKREDSAVLYTEGRLQLDSVLKRLGCIYEAKEDGFYLEIPDCEALLANWEALMEECPALFPLDLVSNEGIEDDLAFFHSSVAHDGIYSLGQGAVHDFQFHMVECVSIIVDCINSHSSADAKKEYLKMKSNIKKAMLINYRRIMLTEQLINNDSLSLPKERILQYKDNLQKFKAFLGAFADELPNISDYKITMEANLPLSNFASYVFEQPLSEPLWQNYWAQQRQSELGAFDFDLLLSLWKEMETIESQFDQYNKRRS